MSYYRDPVGNFGDDLNSWLWHALLPEVFKSYNPHAVLLGIGTILSERKVQTLRWADVCMTIGSGAGYGPPARIADDERWKLVRVRGPLTAEFVGLPETSVGTDGAILIALLSDFRPLPCSMRSGVVFMPHHRISDPEQWRRACSLAGIEYLDPAADSRALLNRIRSAKLVLADAMHAAICADTLRVPWFPLSTSSQISTFKWLDWTQSMGVPYNPKTLPFISAAARSMDALVRRTDGVNRVDPPDPELAVLNFRRECRRRERLSRASRPRRILNRLLRELPTISGFGTEPPCSDAVVDELTTLRSASGYLSDDAHFRDCLALMSDSVRQVPAVLSGVRAGAGR